SEAVVRLALVAEAIGEAWSAELQTELSARRQRGILTIARRVNGGHAVVGNTVAAADYVLTLSGDIPRETEAGREVQGVSLPGFRNDIHATGGDGLLIAARSRNEVTKTVLRIGVRSEVVVAESQVQGDVAADLPVILEVDVAFPDALIDARRGRNTGTGIHS